MQSWLTHFAIVIEFEFTELWLLERGEGGITFRPFNPEESTFHQDFRWEEWHHCDGHYTDQSCSGSSKVLCNIHCAENDFVTREQVWKYVEDQMEHDYNILHLNCKHMAYYFYRHFDHHWARDVDFPTFSESMEARWVENRGW